MKKLRNISFALILAAMLPQPYLNAAGSIAIDIESGSATTEETATVSCKLTNRGDSSAHHLSIEAEAFGNITAIKCGELLRPGESTKITIPIGKPPALKGVYTVALKTRYEDQFGHNYSAVSHIPYASTIPDNPEEALSAFNEIHDLYSDITFRLKVTKELNSLTNGTPATITLLLPDELTCYNPQRNIKITEESASLPFRIFNRSAIKGSIYPFYAIIDYEHEGCHRSFTAPGAIRIKATASRMHVLKTASLFLIPALLFIIVINTRKDLCRFLDRDIPRTASFIILTGAALFTLYHLRIDLIFTDTLTVGGDTAAHSYMASHLGEQFFSSGRIVSWADGWWSGFSMYQYYFFLPYLIIALLDTVMPFNIAFKIVSIMGAMLLPASIYIAARTLRSGKFIPALAAAAMVPYLFVHTHTMWGVNLYSTMAGMISNSLSFPLMILFIASAWRDADDGKFRLRTVLLMAATISSHFFTTIIAVPLIAILPALKPKAGFKKAFCVLAAEGISGALLMAWWLVPLIAKGEFSVDFGTNWPIPLFEQSESFSFPHFQIMAFPAYSVFLLPLAAWGLFIGIKQREKLLFISLAMFTVSTFLFFAGFSLIGPVFVNVRLWPFMFFSYLIFTVYGTGSLISRIRTPWLGVIFIFGISITLGIDQPNDTRQWAKWNYEGLEKKTAYDVFEKLVLPLDGTPGRLANDLSADNDAALGSSRVFETVPHLIKKPILEGGIVNSAAGSIFSYYIQGETSENCAGFPTIVKPTTFNMTNGTRHLELFNVKHFIARWEKTKAAMADSKEWKFIDRAGNWELYELTSHDGSYVTIPENYPHAMISTNWQQSGLDWIYKPDTLDQMFAIIRSDSEPTDPFEKVLSPEEFSAYLSDPSGKRRPANPGESSIKVHEASSNRVKFTTDSPGKPHLIKYTYSPNWKVKGAERIYMVTPCFMLVYPTEKDVELRYGYTASDNTGRLLSSVTLAFLSLYYLVSSRRDHKKDNSQTD